jgi:hypothetical protein
MAGARTALAQIPSAQADIRPSALQRSTGPLSLGEPRSIPPIVHEVLRAPGRPLEPTLRGSMEAFFHKDFSGVRVRTNDRASQSAEAVNAEAYTVGQDIVFGRDRFAPQSTEGRRLLAHELAHVAQDGHTSAPPTDVVGVADSAEETAADRAADLAMRGGRIGELLPPRISGGLRRQATTDPFAAAQQQIITLGETQDAASRQRALDLILSTYYQRPPNFDGIFYDANFQSTSPQGAETGPSPGQPSFGGRQRTTISPRFFNNIRSRFDQRVRTIGHELQHVGQRSPGKERSVGSTFAGIGVGAAIGAAAGGIGLGIAAAAHATMSAGLIGGVLGAAGAVGGLIGGLTDPFASSPEPVRNQHTREFLAIHWTVTSQVRGIGALPRGQMLQNINQPGAGALAEYQQMPAEDQQRYRRQYEEILEIKRRLESQAPASTPASGSPANPGNAAPTGGGR